MRIFRIGIVLTAVWASLLTTTAILADDVDDAVQMAFNEACVRTDRQRFCRDVDLPNILVSESASRFGYNGLFLAGGTSTIVLSVDNPHTEPFGFVVLVHEIIHYLDYMQGLFPENSSSVVRCIAEERAFDVSMPMLVEYGLSDRVFDWRLNYGC